MMCVGGSFRLFLKCKDTIFLSLTNKKNGTQQKKRARLRRLFML